MPASGGYNSIRVVNLFAYRATDPAQLRRVDDPVGPEIGLPVLMFVGELAAAGQHRDQLPDSLVAAREQAVTTATLTAAGCLAGLVDAIQAVCRS